jgi:hypothetical protein
VNSEGKFKHRFDIDPLGPSKDDIVLDCGGVKILVYKPSQRKLQGTLIDAKRTRKGTRFVFRNPNASDQQLIKQLIYEHQLRSFALAYHVFADGHGRGPRSLDEVPTNGFKFGQVADIIHKRKFIVAWGAVLRGTAEDNHKYWLAYDIAVLEKEGMVVRADAALELMGKDQFKKLRTIPLERGNERRQ